ncbi:MULTISPECIES: DUF1672 family protein [Cytobacillus]|nr:DUF1672 family protein [Cytobacillus stercorigallinarum]
MNNTEQTPTSDEFLISVLEYNGEGYALPYGKETDQIAEEYREEIEAKTIKFFQENYQTEIVVHNVVGALNGATIFVESVGEPHFYTNAFVPVDEKEKKVMTDQISADNFQVKNAIKGGLYHMIFSDEFKKLDKHFESLVADDVTGKTLESLQNVGGHGFQTPYYFISITNKETALEPVYELYMQNPEESVKHLRATFEDELFDATNLFINIQLFMAEEKEKPNTALFDELTQELEGMDEIPKGSYSFVLNDHFIDKQSASGMGEHSIDMVGHIIKE